MNPFWDLLGEAVRAPLPYVWRPLPPAPVDQALLKRVLAGLEQLDTQHRASHAASTAEAHPVTAGQATAT